MWLLWGWILSPTQTYNFFFSNIAIWNHMVVRSLGVLCPSCKNNLCSGSPFLSLAPPILALTGSSVAAAQYLSMSYCRVSAIIGDKSLLCLWLLVLLWLKCPWHSNSSFVPLKLRSCLASVSHPCTGTSLRASGGGFAVLIYWGIIGPGLY